MASNDRTKVVRGPCDCQIKESGGSYASVGIVGDVRVQITNVQQDQAGEPYGPIPFDVFHEGHDIRVIVPMKQTTVEHFTYAIGGHGAAGYVYFEDRPGLEPKYGLKLVPVAGKSTGGVDPVANYAEFYQVVAESLDEIVWSRSEERLYNVTFKVVIDTTRPAGRRLGIWNLSDN
jgi:hypothetical protein